MSFLDWLSALAQDADPVKPGFQAQGLYLLVCVTGPVLFGGLVALTLTGLERLFGIRLSSKGGH
ncbi:MAG: hypothetical protein HY906_01585 [Deltaproteobacteria bacterium]|nr:hypothetical protein [Deltaproteobacteria bacterium]